MSRKYHNKKLRWAKRCACPCHENEKEYTHRTSCCPVPNLKVQKRKLPEHEIVL